MLHDPPDAVKGLALGFEATGRGLRLDPGCSELDHLAALDCFRAREPVGGRPDADVQE